MGATRAIPTALGADLSSPAARSAGKGIQNPRRCSTPGGWIPFPRPAAAPGMTVRASRRRSNARAVGIIRIDGSLERAPRSCGSSKARQRGPDGDWLQSSKGGYWQPLSASIAQRPMSRLRLAISVHPKRWFARRSASPTSWKPGTATCAISWGALLALPSRRQ
jgi:hypothetical protein